jgi:hypothetical protein
MDTPKPIAQKRDSDIPPPLRVDISLRHATAGELLDFEWLDGATQGTTGQFLEGFG